MRVLQKDIEKLMRQYAMDLRNIYGEHLRSVILYGSYARGDFGEESDIDIMILLDISELEIKNYRHQLSDMTFDYNWDYDVDIRPIAKSEQHFLQWEKNYPFYASIRREGVVLYDAA